MRALYNKYGKYGLVAIGQHIGDDAETRSLNNLKQHMDISGINYAVIQDPSHDNGYTQNTRYLPVFFLIDRQGHLRYQQVGGVNPALEETIITLLNETAGE